jgi:solute carrier family 25 phosphate transporter 23/24/25/41
MWLSQLSDHKLGIVGRLCCSGAAGITSVIVSYPLDVIRCRLSAQHEIVQYKGIVDAFRQIYRAEGIRGLYRGIFPTILVNFILSKTHIIGYWSICCYQFYNL